MRLWVRDIPERSRLSLRTHVALWFLVFAVLVSSCTRSPVSNSDREEPREQEPPLRPFVIWLEADVKPAEAVDNGPLDEVPEVVHFERPKYPDLSRAAGIEGIVHLEVVVGAEGGVDGVKVVSSTVPPAMEWSALEAARKSEYRPGMRGGQAIDSKMVHRIHFELR